MAILTSLGKPESDVVGVGCFPKVRQVTADAVRRGSLVPSAYVTGGAVETGMCPRQCESGHFQVIEGGAKPCRDRVALLASGRESRGRVVGPGRLLIGCRVARIALERKSLKLADGGSLVAAVALQGGMAANQRKAVLVIPHGLNRDLPALHGVAAFAICAHLAVMNVSVTIPASRAGVGKDRLRVTLGAGHVFMHPQKRVAGFAVIKFRNRAYRFPPKDGVAILAGDIQVAVGTARRGRATSLRTRLHDRYAQQHSGKGTNPGQPETPPPTTPHAATSLTQLVALALPNDHSLKSLED